MKIWNSIKFCILKNAVERPAAIKANQKSYKIEDLR